MNWKRQHWRNVHGPEWRWLFGTIIEWFTCRKHGHHWVVEPNRRWDVLGDMWIHCTRCACCAEVRIVEWDLHNTPLHQAIRKAL